MMNSDGGGTKTSTRIADFDTVQTILLIWILQSENKTTAKRKKHQQVHANL